MTIGRRVMLLRGIICSFAFGVQVLPIFSFMTALVRTEAGGERRVRTRGEVRGKRPAVRAT